MSAFMCSDLHILSLLRFAETSRYGVYYTHNGIRRKLEDGALDRAAKVLHAANASSVNYRYAHNTVVQEPLSYRRVPLLDALTVIKLCHRYAYQSGEHDSWSISEAKFIVDAIMSSATTRLPGYDAAPWGI